MFGILPATSTFGGQQNFARSNLFRPYPAYNGITANTLPKSFYRYDALQVRIEKRAFSSKNAGVMTFVMAYTFSKAFEQNHRLNGTNYPERLIYELDNTDKPQGIAFSGVWDLPMGTGRKLFNVQNKLAKHLVNDWRITWIYTYYSGYPVGWPDLVNNCSDWHYTGSGNPFDHWFNNDRTCYTFRRFPDIRNPAEPQFNASIEKTIRLSERYSMLIRAEGFNITNTPMYGGPNTDFNNPSFGVVPADQQNFPRFFQFAAKFIF